MDIAKTESDGVKAVDRRFSRSGMGKGSRDGYEKTYQPPFRIERRYQPPFRSRKGTSHRSDREKVPATVPDPPFRIEKRYQPPFRIEKRYQPPFRDPGPRSATVPISWPAAHRGIGWDQPIKTSGPTNQGWAIPARFSRRAWPISSNRLDR